MKTKNKVLTLLEIAIVLCSLFLVAVPAIAADQNQTMQKMTASTITTASEDDYVLGIYGNANEDDTIDMRDLTYVKLIFFGKKSETELADAKYDGKINPLDFIQTKLIIVGKEKELTLVDVLGKDVTVNMPVKRIIAHDDSHGEPLRLLGAVDLVVGAGENLVTHDILLPEMSKLPTIGGMRNVDSEKVISLNPDLFITFGSWAPGLEEHVEPYGITVLRLDCMNPRTISEDVKKLGYLLGKVDGAEEFVDFNNDILDKIKARTEGLSEDEQPRVYIETLYYYRTCIKGVKQDDACIMAGGVNIAHDLILPGAWPKIDPEWVITQNPDFIMGCTFKCGFGIEDRTEVEAVREEIMNRPELANVNAVKNGKVYITSNDIAFSGLQGFACVVYWAKWLHPDLFEDLDPQAIHQEYLDRFMRIDYDLDEHGPFVYPPLES
jgi:iron complex transport system substrate-binding protein